MTTRGGGSTRAAAFLRGINLGRRRVTNDALCAAFEAMGFGDVHAFLASGNIVFDAGGAAAADLQSEIAAGLEKAFGWAVPTCVRAADPVRAIAARGPFSPEVIEASSGKLQVMLLSRALDAAAARRVAALSTDDDRLRVDGSEIYWLPEHGVAGSELDGKALARALGDVTVTVRVHNTLVRIAAKYFG